MDIKKEISDLKKKSFSNEEIIDTLGRAGIKTNLIPYSKLQNIIDLDDIFVDNNCVILYESRERYGHWVCIQYLPSVDTYRFFDSYGLKPDDEIDFIPEYFRKISGTDYPHLTWLLLQKKNNKHNIEYNEYELQKHSKDINTCGRWVCMRILLTDIPNDEFAHMFRDEKNVYGDDIVTLLTGFV